MTKFRCAKTIIYKLCALLSIAACLLYAHPGFALTDSAIGPGNRFAPVTPEYDDDELTTTDKSSLSGTPYILTSGSYNALTGEIRGSFSDGTTPPQNIRCSAESTGAYAHCVVNIDSITSRACSKGFTPVARTSITSSRATNGTPSFACPIRETVNPIDGEIKDNRFNQSVYQLPSGNYGFRVLVSGTSTKIMNNMITTPAISFDWDIICYPNSRAPIMESDALRCAKISSNDVRQIITLESGFQKWNRGPKDRTVTTQSRCPLNYIPYVVAAPNMAYLNQQYGTTDRVHPLTEFRICVRNVTLNPNNTSYTITFRQLTSWILATVTSSSLTMQDAASAYDRSGAIAWTLYCYPPGKPPPFTNNQEATLNGYCNDTQWRPD